MPFCLLGLVISNGGYSRFSGPGRFSQNHSTGLLLWWLSHPPMPPLSRPEAPTEITLIEKAQTPRTPSPNTLLPKLKNEVIKDKVHGHRRPTFALTNGEKANGGAGNGPTKKQPAAARPPSPDPEPIPMRRRAACSRAERAARSRPTRRVPML